MLVLLLSNNVTEGNPKNAKKSATPRGCAEVPPKEEVLEEYVQLALNTTELCQPVASIASIFAAMQNIFYQRSINKK